GPPIRWPSDAFGVEAEIDAAATGGSTLAARGRVLLRTAFSTALFRFGLSVGGFDPARYRRELVENTDFRKFDDGLRMTIDCTPALATRIEARLAAAEGAGVARTGTFRQTASLMTCFVPSATRSDHVHFLDGAAGGYAQAASALKAKEAHAKRAPDRSDAPLI
ncbi:DUF3095 family protein, partial [Aureimonas sp. AU12]|uniref:DUF3095 family protein n=1 Tax=Aureimonas sp. AU12 TaxID=1638161 RepID=UPI000A9EE58F